MYFGSTCISSCRVRLVDGRGPTLSGHPLDGRRTMCIAQSVRSVNVDRNNDFARSTEHRRRYLSHFSQMRRIAW